MHAYKNFLKSSNKDIKIELFVKVSFKYMWIPYSRKFSRVLIFAVFMDRDETAKLFTSNLF